MATASKEYISLRGIGNLPRCVRCGEEIAAFVKAVDNGRQELYGIWEVRASVDAIRSYFIEEPVIEKVLRITASVVPVLIVNFTYNPESIPDSSFPHAEGCFELVLVKSCHLPRRPWR